MKRIHKITFLILGILTLLLIEFNPNSNFGYSRLYRTKIKGSLVIAHKQITLSVESVQFTELVNY